MLSKGDAALITVVGCTRIAAKVAVCKLSYAEIRACLAIQGMPRRASWNALTGSLILLHLIRLIKEGGHHSGEAVYTWIVTLDR